MVAARSLASLSTLALGRLLCFLPQAQRMRLRLVCRAFREAVDAALQLVEFVTDSPFADVAKRFPKLEQVIFRDTRSLQDRHVRDVVKNTTWISQLHLEDCVDITDRALYSIARAALGYMT
eukprot:TRINITY_DN5744_c0_g1_i1.p1 TRINITY_DN5744_c0_g1~~TRINITY_DN5744_c0_g1_i1.p1  ORF type:complete len:121 (-),score=16.34 TRINITY_DN5744_c0_g1_i1:187-549(-)